ncbi:MAG: Uncharacterised protein [Synechococcus sp. MIT S9220]|nr:MAG: Uncharacterised protein [Synechococcus sp. MIT S9220]
MLGDQLLDQSLASQWIGLKVAGALKRCGQHLAAQTAARWRALIEVFELQFAGPLQLFQCQGVDKPLTEHPVERSAKSHIPIPTLILGSFLQPLLLVERQVHRSDALGIDAVRDPFQFAEVSLQPHADLLVFLRVQNLHEGAGSQA